MSHLEDFVSLVLLLGLVMYALFGGADFGGGIWTALASGPRKIDQREALFRAIGPVWETNHIWLIFIVVVLFTAFPRGFAPLFTWLLVPFVVALLGVTFRGAAFAFRHFGRETGRGVPFIARTFEISSILTPFAMGVAVTATAGGRVTVVNGVVRTTAFDWLTPFTLMGGLVGLAVCAYLAPIYAAVRVRGALQNDFRKRGMIAGVVLGIVTAIEIPVAMADAPIFAARLLQTRAVSAVALAALFGIAAELLLWKKSYHWAQITAAGAVALTIAGFCAALYPDLIIGQLPLKETLAPRETIITFFAIMPVGLLVLVPSLLFFYRVLGLEPVDVPREKS